MKLKFIPIVSIALLGGILSSCEKAAENCKVDWSNDDSGYAYYIRGVKEKNRYSLTVNYDGSHKYNTFCFKLSEDTKYSMGDSTESRDITIESIKCSNGDDKGGYSLSEENKVATFATYVDEDITFNVKFNTNIDGEICFFAYLVTE